MVLRQDAGGNGTFIKMTDRPMMTLIERAPGAAAETHARIPAAFHSASDVGAPSHAGGGPETQPSDRYASLPVGLRTDGIYYQPRIANAPDNGMGGLECSRPASEYSQAATRPSTEMDHSQEARGGRGLGVGSDRVPVVRSIRGGAGPSVFFVIPVLP